MTSSSNETITMNVKEDIQRLLKRLSEYENHDPFQSYKEQNKYPLTCDNDTQKQIPQESSPIFNADAMRLDMQEISKRLHDLEQKQNHEGTPNLRNKYKGKTIEEIMHSNRRSLGRTLQILSTKIDMNQFDEKMEQMKEYVSNQMCNLKGEIVEKSSLCSLREAVSALSQRMDLLAQTTSQKVDHSCITTLKSDVESIRSHAEFVTDTKESLKQLRKQSQDNSKRIENQQKTIETLVSQQTEMMEKIGTLIPKLEYQNLEERVNNFISFIESTMAKQQDLQITQSQMDTYIVKIAESDKIIKKLQIAHEKLATYTANRFGKVYSKETTDNKIHKCVTMEKFKHCLGECNSDLEDRSIQLDESVASIHQKLELLERDYSETKKRSVLAAEFIDWYGRKGDAYEHNLSAVDGHLKNMVRHHNDGGTNLTTNFDRYEEMSPRENDSLW